MTHPHNGSSSNSKLKRLFGLHLFKVGDVIRSSCCVVGPSHCTRQSIIRLFLSADARQSAHLLSHEKIKIKFSTSVPRRRWAPPLHQTARSTLIGGASHHRSHAPIPRFLGVISSSYVLFCGVEFRGVFDLSVFKF